MVYSYVLSHPFSTIIIISLAVVLRVLRIHIDNYVIGTNSWESSDTVLMKTPKWENVEQRTEINRKDSSL